MVALVCASTLLVFDTGARQLGFYSDDAGFLTSLPGAGLAQTIQSAADYVPGRNLHIVWQRLLFLLSGSSPSDLGTLHLVQGVMDAMCVGLVYVLARQLTLPPVWGLVASVVFAFYPNHGETHFWLSSAPMNLMSTILALAYAVVVARNVARHRELGSAHKWVAIVLELVLMPTALFTYDQVFFVLMLVASVRILFLAIEKEYVRAGAVITACAITFLFYAHLKSNPSTGPTLSNVSLAHIAETMRVSASMSVGPIFHLLLDDEISTASKTDVLVSLAAALGFMIAAVGLSLRDWLVRRVTVISAAGGIGWRSLFVNPPGSYLCVVLLAASWIFLAYGPSYIWFISPRHNFLPTVGTALALGGAGALITNIGRGRIARAVGCGLGIGVIGWISTWVLVFVAANLSEKSSWIDAYQLRAKLYADVVATAPVSDKTAIIFENFPANLGAAPFFAQENHLAMNYLYPSAARLTVSGISSISTDQGYFIQTELDRYGVAVRFVPREKVIHLSYRGQDSDRLRVAVGGDGVRANDLYSVAEEPGPASESGAGTAGDDRIIEGAYAQPGPSGTNLSLDIDFRHVTVTGNGEIGLLARTHQGQQDVPLFIRNSYGERIVVPLALGRVEGDEPWPMPLHVSIELHGLDAQSIESMALYYFSEGPPQLLQEMPVKSVTGSV